ncbi:MAG TPA: pyridoxal-dependent decarboxylase [Nocardioides sp.]|nr:pyridoxal-dependent decarboxylase [Nocardioides sp.]
MDETGRVLSRAEELAQEFLTGLGSRPVWPRATFEEMLAVFDGPLPESGADPLAVVEELARNAEAGLVGTAGPRFFGFVIGGSMPAALGADVLTSTWDQNAGLNSLTPAAAAVEVAAGRWVVEALGLPVGSAVGLVTGGMMANYSCLSAARHAVLAGVGWDVSARGLFEAPRVRVVVGRYRHDTIDRAVRYLGLGQEAVIEVDTDDEGRISVDALESTLAAGQGPVIVCLGAGEVHSGAFDDFARAIPVARRHDAWVHVDGAFGLWAAASPSYRHLTLGMADADSWATDAHKTLNVPYDSGLAIVRDPAALSAGFGVVADYLIGAAGDPMARTPEFSRRARGFAVWAALRSLGRDGLAVLVDRLCATASMLAKGFEEVDEVEIVNDVVFTQVMFRLSSDERTAELGRRLLTDGTCVVTPALWRGRAVQRCSVSNWSTSETDVAVTVAAVRRVVAAL